MSLLSKILLFIVVSALIAVPPDAFAVKQELSTEQWQQLTADTAFNYRDKKEFEMKTQTTQVNNWDNMVDRALQFFTTGIGKFIFWTTIILLLAYAAYKILYNERFSLFKKEKKKQTDPAELSEEDITLVNWEQLLQTAVNTSDLRLAVRYSYMWLLQLLQSRELIQYRNDKTNYDYYSELADTAYKQPFKELSRQYEYCWYGHFRLSETAYNNYMELFNNVKARLS